LSASSSFTNRCSSSFSVGVVTGFISNLSGANNPFPAWLTY
jgi:hypothetical protein